MSWSAGLWIAVAAFAGQASDDPALDLYYAANALHRRGLHELAAGQYAEFLKAHGGHAKAPAARLGLAASYLALGRPADAEPLLASLAADPKAEDAARIHLLRGQALAALDRAEAAEKAFETARDRSPDATGRSAAEAGLLELHIRARRWAAATEVADRLARSRDDTMADRALYQGALARLELGRPEEARRDLARFVERRAASPLLPQARLLLGECLLASEDFDGAIREFQAVRAAERESEAHFRKAESLHRRKQWDSAAEAYRASGNRDAALLRLADVEERRGKPAEARAALERLLRDHPTSGLRTRAAVDLGRLRIEAGEPAAARKALEEAGPDPSARYYLGWVALAEKKDDEAARHFQAAQEAGSDPSLRADAALQSGLLSFRSGDVRAAERHFEKATGGTRSETAWLHLGLARARQERWEPALEAFSRAAIGAEREQALFRLALCERRLGRPREAAKRFGEFLSEFPSSAHAVDAALEWAEIEIEAKEPEAAVRRLSALLGRELPAEAEARTRYRLGTACLAAGERERAAEAFEAIRGTDPATAALAAHQAGEARLRLKELDRAAAHFEAAARAGEKNPLLEASLLRRAECDALAGRWTESEKAFRKFLEERPGSAHAAQAHFGLGWALENLGKPEEALPAYAAAVEAGGRSEIAARSRFQRGECHFALGRYDRAVEELIQVEANYAYPEWSARALLEIGRALQAQDRPGPAAARYREVVERYAKTEAAAAARQLLERMPRR
jgi:TolA-binding protein